ncbi:MAG: hypothetical protein QOE33_2460 [Acidobacteriota bacterium]|nr:hypothetical protein [Acidobacteriota bacterium]
MRELVLGGDGLVGSTLIELLRARGREADSFDLKSGGDLRRVEPEAFDAYDRVWFLAWDTGGAKYIESGDRQHEQYKNNCELSVRTFEALARSRKPFIFATSQLAGLPNAYGTTKLMSEKWAEHLGGKIARLWNTYGWEHPDEKSHVVTDMVLSALTEHRISCMTSGEEHRRFNYKTDCAAALIQLFDGPQHEGDIAGPKWLSIREVAEEIGRQLDVTDLNFGTRKGTEIIVDPTIPVEGWKPELTFSDGIAKVIADARLYLSERRTTGAGGHQG